MHEIPCEYLSSLVGILIQIPSKEIVPILSNFDGAPSNQVECMLLRQYKKEADIFFPIMILFVNQQFWIYIKPIP